MILKQPFVWKAVLLSKNEDSESSFAAQQSSIFYNRNCYSKVMSQAYTGTYAIRL